MASLRAEPRWDDAARGLIDGCVDLPHDEDRVAFLASVCTGLGDELYPALLHLLCMIGERGDHAARAAVAGTLVHALRTGRLPSGRRGAWGAAASDNARHGFCTTRSLGPIEYLCAWHAQGDAGQALAAEHFQVAACALMDLVSADLEARRLYCEKLLADADDPLSGVLTRQTREALRALALAWSGGASSHEASARYLNALSATAAGRHGPLICVPVFPPR
jgi:hypothetical protein